MKYDDIKLSFIDDYISSYERKIKNANKNGLFDLAKLFESFALALCELYFGFKFENLNLTVQENYPCVDLKSIEGNIFIQVSTCKDYDNKIYKTLNDIKNSDRDDLKTIKNLYFFFLNYTDEKVNDRTGDNKIGNIDFKKEDNLITTADIIFKARNDSAFMNNLYKLLKDDEDTVSNLSSLFYEAIDQSRVAVDSIPDTIGDNYIIDRNELVNSINGCENQIVVITGNPGCGKTVVAKNICKNKKYILFKRAEDIMNKTRLSDIWGLDIELVSKLSGEQTIYICIDSLEFIADLLEKIDMIKLLCKLVNKHKNIKLIMTCRLYDYQAFAFIQSNYNVSSFLVEKLNEKEFREIIKHFPFLSAYLTNNNLPLLQIPFYIDLVVRYFQKDKLLNVNGSEFRNYIFDEIICCRKACKSGIANIKNVRLTVLEIAKKRASEFLVDLDKNDFDERVINLLLSQDVISENNGRIRLKYDIFEDICFEKIIDKMFIDSREDIETFISSLSSLGKCAPRRFQIWIDDALYLEETINKFIVPLVFEDEYEFWGEQAIISISKSDHSSLFFKLLSFKISDDKYLLRFIDVINLYAYKVKSFESQVFGIFVLEPFGFSRNYLINNIFKNDLYKKLEFKNSVEMMCNDVAKSTDSDSYTKSLAIEILKYFFDLLFTKDEYKTYGSLAEIKDILSSIYMLGSIGKKWIIQLWSNLLKYIESHNNLEMVSSKMIEITLSSIALSCSSDFTEELFDLAEKFWTIKDRPSIFMSRSLDNYEDYGLGKYCEDFRYSRNKHLFLGCVFYASPFVAIKKAVNLMNKFIFSYASYNKVPTISLIYKSNKYDYYFIPELWICFVRDGHNIPKILSDILYHAKEALLFFKGKPELLLQIKDYVLRNTNNIGFISVLNVVGIELFDVLPGFSIELLQSIDLVYLDIRRYVEVNPTSSILFLEDQIFKKCGIYNYKNEYSGKCGKAFSIREYVLKTSFCFKEYEDYIFAELNKLYKKYHDNKEYISQVEKMDLRKYDIEKMESEFILKPNQNIESANDNKIPSHVVEIEKLLKINDNNNKEELAERIKQAIQLGIDKVDHRYICEENIIQMIAIALSLDGIDYSYKSEWILYWVSGTIDLLEGKSFVFDEKLFIVLLKQFDDTRLTKDNKKDLLRVIYMLLSADNNGDGVIASLEHYCRSFLTTHIDLATILFCNLCCLAKISYECLKYSDNNLQSGMQSIDFDHEKYEKAKNDCLSKFITLNSVDVEINEDNVKQFDIKILGKAINCGISLSGPCYSLIKTIYSLFINLLSNSKDKYLSFSADFKDFLERQLLNKTTREIVLRLMFDDINFSNATIELVSFYNDVFSYIKSIYLDYKDYEEGRYSIENFLKQLETKITSSNFGTDLKELLFASLIMGGDERFTDFSKIQKKYSEYDKTFLSKIFSKYGFYNYDRFLQTLRQFDVRLLMPEILVSIEETFRGLESHHSRKYNEIIKEKTHELEYVIILGSTDYIENIKHNLKYSHYFESLLKRLILNGWAEAAIALDIFTAH